MFINVNMRSAIENWYAKVCKISEYSIRYTLKVGLTPRLFHLRFRLILDKCVIL